MAGLIAALFGGKTRPADPDPMPGLGGYAQGPGPSGENGLPGSTSRTRTFRGNNPRQIGAADWTTIKSGTNTGFDQKLSSVPQTRQASYRADIRPTEIGKSVRSANPRGTSRVSTLQPQLTVTMQETPATLKGGPMLRTGPGNQTAGGQLSRRTSSETRKDPRDTTTLWKDANSVIGQNTPGSSNVRNEVAQRYKNKPGEMHTYWAAYRADQASVSPGGQASDGNVQTHEGQQQVTVPSRFVMNPGDGNLTWHVQREMPYGGRGDGARGADLNGQRYYATGQQDQFGNAGMGDYGIARQRGGRRPVGFTQPAPWTANFYDTTDSVGTNESPNDTPAQSPNMVYISPSTGRANSGTGRTG